MKKLNDIQLLNLNLMRKATFNNFEGDDVVDMLIKNKDLWKGLVMTRLKDLIYLRDIEDNDWNVDTLFIIAEEGKEKDLELLVSKHFFADEVDYLEEKEVKDLLGTSKETKVLRVWWD